MTDLADHRSDPRVTPSPPIRRRFNVVSQLRRRDARWKAMTLALGEMRTAKRRSVRINSANCSSGLLFFFTVRHAYSLGFISTEAWGIDDEAMTISCAAPQCHLHATLPLASSSRRMARTTRHDAGAIIPPIFKAQRTSRQSRGVRPFALRLDRLFFHQYKFV